MRRAIAVLLVALAPLTARAQASDIASKIARAERALDEWDITRAEQLAAELTREVPDIPPVQALLGRLKFHQGDYTGAVALLERASEAGQAHPLLELAKSTKKETEGYVTAESAHFKLRVPAGKDEVLLDIGLEALEKAYAEITKAYDFAPSHKIPVDVLHDTTGLANVSTLTRQEIETSGTIALCKYNRLMITSPKALARGYSWLDTLAHELLHLIISEKSNNAVPIWLHEGLAKYSESLWRGEAGLALTPVSENLLAKAVKANKLITFEQMHPSMAKLPSQEDTALAFAEVFTVIEFLHKEHAGFSGTNKLLEELRAGKEMDAALKASVGSDLEGLQAKWRRYLRKRKFTLTPGAKARELKFVKNARRRAGGVDEDEAEAAIAEAATREGRRFVRLGNLLRNRGRARAATVEYEKASASVGNMSPALHNRMAGLYIELGEPQRAVEILEKNLKVFPDDPQTNVLMGRVKLRAGDAAGAKESYLHATWENPFNPEIWVALYQIAKDAGDDEGLRQAERALKLLAGHAKKQAKAAEPLGAFGTLSIDSTPWGELWVDGKRMHMTTPVVDLKLKPGEHAIRVEDALSGKIAFARVTVAEGKSERLSLPLQPADPAERERRLDEESKWLAGRGDAPKTDAGP